MRSIADRGHARDAGEPRLDPTAATEAARWFSGSAGEADIVVPPGSGGQRNAAPRPAWLGGAWRLVGLVGVAALVLLALRHGPVDPGHVERAAGSVDLQISADMFLGTGDPGVDCDDDPPGGIYEPNQDSGLILLETTGAFPTSGADDGGTAWLCLKNAGGDPAVLSGVTAFNLADSETGCGVVEPSADTTCGSGAGELTSEVQVRVHTSSNGDGTCNSSGASLSWAGDLATAASKSFGSPPTISAGATRCVRIQAFYDASLVSGSELQANSTDRLAFRLRFEAS